MDQCLICGHEGCQNYLKPLKPGKKICTSCGVAGMSAAPTPAANPPQNPAATPAANPQNPVPTPAANPPQHPAATPAANPAPTGTISAANPSQNPAPAGTAPTGAGSAASKEWKHGLCSCCDYCSCSCIFCGPCIMAAAYTQFQRGRGQRDASTACNLIQLLIPYVNLACHFNRRRQYAAMSAIYPPPSIILEAKRRPRQGC